MTTKMLLNINMKGIGQPRANLWKTFRIIMFIVFLL